MSDKKIVVPEGMLEAGVKAAAAHPGVAGSFKAGIEAALRWLAENPPHPTEKQCLEMWRAADNHGDRYCQEWVRRMFLAEPEVPEEIKDLLWDESIDKMCARASANKDILEAFKRGKASK